LLGVKLRFKITTTSKEIPSEDRGVIASYVNTPVYEEVKLTNVTPHIEILRNNAYSVSKK